MSSTVHIVDFHDNNRVLKLMMSKAGYVTSSMKPLSGSLEHQSRLVLKYFMSGVVARQHSSEPPFPSTTSAFGTP